MHAEVFVNFAFWQSVKALDAFVNQVGPQLVNRTRMGLENSYSGCQFFCTDKLTHLFSVSATSVEIKGPTANDGGGWSPDNPSVRRPSSPKPVSSPAKRPSGGIKTWVRG